MKIYPNRTIEHAARAAGAHVMCLWEIPGPKDTGIAWMSALAINSTVVIVQTYAADGFEVYTPCEYTHIDDTIRYVLDRCHPEAVS